MHRIVIDQSKIRVDEDLARRGAPGFPRSLTWWKRNLPLLADVAELQGGRIVLTVNGKLPNGRQIELTPAVRRRRMNVLRESLDRKAFLDFSNALIEG